MRRALRRWRWGIVALVLAALVFIGGMPTAGWVGGSALAQLPPTISITNAAPAIYQQVPFLPLANDYVDESGEPVPDSTLLSRMLRYHSALKRRIPYFRLDWKLTMADYLGANDTMHRADYPNADILSENPMDADIEAVRQLTRSQRDALIDAIVLTLNPLAQEVGATTSPAHFPEALPDVMAPSTPVRDPAPARPREPRPGDAQLLFP